MDYITVTTRDISQNLLLSLNQLGGKVAPQGAEVLLARAIADRINYQVLVRINDNISQYMIANKFLIQSLYDFLSPYLKIEDPERVNRCIQGFIRWKLSIILPNSSVIFSRGEDYAIDELSKLPTYVPIDDLCTVKDIYHDATFYSNLFHRVLEETHFEMKTV